MTTSHTSAIPELQDKRSRQKKIKRDRDLLMAKARKLTSDWHRLEKECREIEAEMPLGQATQDSIAKDRKHRYAIRGSRAMLSSHYLEAFDQHQNLHFLLFAMNSALAHNEPVPEQSRHWFCTCVGAYLTKLHKMQEGVAPPCLAQELNIPSPASDVAVTPSIKDYFNWLRNKRLAQEIVFLMTCFESLGYTEACGIMAEQKYFVPRGADDKLTKALCTVNSIKDALGSSKVLKSRYGYLYHDWNFGKIQEHMKGLRLSEHQNTSLRTRIVIRG